MGKESSHSWRVPVVWAGVIDGVNGGDSLSLSLSLSLSVMDLSE